MEPVENIEKLDKILRDSAELFKKYGIRSIAMEDIARELGISKKTLYQFVDSKSDLLCKAFNKLMIDFEGWIEGLRNQNLNAIDELLEISKRVNDEYTKFNPSNIFDLQKYYPEIFKSHVNAKKQLAYKLICENLTNGIGQGLYRHDQDVELIAGLYIQKMQSIHDPEFLGQANLSMGKIFETMFENHIRGIANPQGIIYFETQKQQLNFE